jgi:hypothetical protein
VHAIESCCGESGASLVLDCIVLDWLVLLYCAVLHSTALSRLVPYYAAINSTSGMI